MDIFGLEECLHSKYAPVASEINMKTARMIIKKLIDNSWKIK
jgi:hypothetical protein